MYPHELPPPHGVDVWHISLDEEQDDWRSVLSETERATAARRRLPIETHRYVAAHGITRALLGRYLRVDPRALWWKTGIHGRPEFTDAWSDWRFNLSHSDGHALLAVSVSVWPGVDMERVRSRNPTATAIRFLPPEEADTVMSSMDPATAYHRLLARKEACIKAIGGRILEALHLPVTTAHVRPETGRYAGLSWTVQDLPAPAGYVAALATSGEPVRYDHFTWG